IRDLTVTGVQTCALPICALYFANASDNPTLVDAEKAATRAVELGNATNVEDLLLLGDIQQVAAKLQVAYATFLKAATLAKPGSQIGRASCRERVSGSGVA